MTGTQNDGTAPLTVIATFRLKGDAAAFEQLLREQGEVMQAGEGFRFGVLARSVDTPGTYVNVAWWRDSLAYLTVVRSFAFASRAMSGVGKLADTRLDRLVALAPGGSLLPDPGTEAGVLELTEYTLQEGADVSAFEHEVKARATTGRSLVRAGGYTALRWGPEAPDTGAAPSPESVRAASARYQVVSVVAPVAV